MKIYDVIIMGAGPAGLTAGLYSARSGMSILIVSKNVGGTVNMITELGNWPGFSGSGKEFIQKFNEQLKKYDIDFIDEEANLIQKKERNFIVKVKDQNIECKSIIIATGTERKKLRIPGEEKFLGKGVSYCTTCDAFFFKDKNVAIITEENCDINSVLVLSDIAKKVYFICINEKKGCNEKVKQKLGEKANIEIFCNSKPIEIYGNEKVEGIKIESEGNNKDIKLDGIFIEMGSTPLAEMTKNVNLKVNNEKFIEVDENMKTSAEGIYAAGDVTNQKLKQVVVASAQGAIAAKSAYEYINRK